MEERLIVFISSRINDEMKQARQVVQEAMEELPVTRAWRFEKSPASADELEESYLRWVSRCDLFILLIGEDVTDPVRGEWETATQARKPRLVFLKKGAQNEEAGAFAKGLNVKWKEYETLDELKREVQAAVGDELIKRFRADGVSRQEMKALTAFVRRLHPLPRWQVLLRTTAAIVTALAVIAIASYFLWPPPQPPTSVVIADSIALRSGPGLEYASVATLPQRERLTLLGRTPNGAWLRVRTENGIEGWTSQGAVGAEEKVIEKLTPVSGPPLPTPTPRPTATPTVTVTATSTPTSTPAPPSVSYEILLDCSRLMEAEFAASGNSKLEEAKRAIRDLIGTLVNPYFVAIRAFGHNELAAAPREDTDLLLPPDRAETQRNRLSDVLDPLKPSGCSALAAALREGLSDLLESGSKTLVLTIFVGGRDDCTGDVRGVIENNMTLPDRDIALDVHLVSLDAGEVEEFEEATQLQVSDRIFFKYTDVKNAAETDSTTKNIVKVIPTLLPSELTPTTISSLPQPALPVSPQATRPPSQDMPAASPTPTSSPTSPPGASPTNTPTSAPTDTPTPTNTPPPTLTNTPLPTPTDTPTPTPKPTDTPTPTPASVRIFCTDSGGGETENIPIEPPRTIGGIQIDLIERALKQYGFSLWEVEIYGPGTSNLAIGATATASSSQDSYGCYGCFPDEAIDGIDSTNTQDNQHNRWGSRFYEPQWLEIILPTPQIVNLIVLKWEAAYAKGYCVTVIE